MAAKRPDVEADKKILQTQPITCNKRRYTHCLTFSKDRLLYFESHGGGASLDTWSKRYAIWQRGPKSQFVHKYRVTIRYKKQNGQWKLRVLRQTSHLAMPLPKLFPTLAQRIKSKSKRSQTIRLIGYHQSPHAFPLLQSFLHKKTSMSYTLSKAFAQMGPSILPKLKREWDKKPTFLLLRIFRKFGAQASFMLPALRKRLPKLKNPHATAMTLRTFGYLGPKARTTLSLLTSYTRHKSKWIRRAATESICMLAKAPKEWQIALTTAAKDKEKTVQYSVDNCLEKIGSTPESHTWIKQNYAFMQDEYNRMTVLRRLAKWMSYNDYELKVDPKTAQKTLAFFTTIAQQPKRKSKVDSDNVLGMAYKIFQAYQHDHHRQALPLSIVKWICFYQFKKMSRNVVTARSGFFRSHRIPVKQAMTILGTGLQSNDSSIAGGSIKLVEALQGHAAHLGSTLAQLLLKKKQVIYPFRIATALQTMGTPSLPILGRLLHHPKLSNSVRKVVKSALIGFGPRAILALPSLKKALKSQDPTIAKAALEVLKETGFWRFAAKRELDAIRRNPSHPHSQTARLLLYTSQNTNDAKKKQGSASNKLSQTAQFMHWIQKAKRKKTMPPTQQNKLYTALHSTHPSAQIASTKERNKLTHAALVAFHDINNPTAAWLRTFANQLNKSIQSGSKKNVVMLLKALSGHRKTQTKRRPNLPAKQLSGTLTQLLAKKGKKPQLNGDIIGASLTLIGTLGPKAKNLKHLVLPYLQSSSWSIRFDAKHAICQLGQAVFPTLRNMLKQQNANTNEQAAGIIGCMGHHARPLTPDLLKALAFTHKRLKKKRNMTNASSHIEVRKAIRKLGKTHVQTILKKQFLTLPLSIQEPLMELFGVLTTKNKKRLLLAALKKGTILPSNNALSAALFLLCRQPKGPTLAQPFFTQGLSRFHPNLLNATFFCITKLPKGKHISPSLLPLLRVWQKDPKQLKLVAMFSTNAKQLHRYYREFQAMSVAALLRLKDPSQHKKAIAFAETLKTWKLQKTLYSMMLKMTHRPRLANKWLLERARRTSMKRYSKYWAYKLETMGKMGWRLLPNTTKLLTQNGPGWSFYGRRAAARAIVAHGLPKGYKVRRLLTLYQASDDDLLQIIVPYLWHQKGMKHPIIFKRIRKELRLGNFYNRSRRMATKLLATLKSPKGLRMLLKQLRDGDTTIEMAALKGLEALRPLPNSAIPALAKALQWQPKYKWKTKAYKPRILHLLADTSKTSKQGTRGLIQGLFFKKPKDVLSAISALTQRQAHRNIFGPWLRILCKHGPKVYQAKACQ